MSSFETLSYQHFINILKNQNNIYDAGNMLFPIVRFPGNMKQLIRLSQGRLNEKDFPFVILSTLSYILILTYESNLNVIKKTLTTSYLTNRRGKAWDKTIEETAPETLLGMLRKHSNDSVTYIEDMIFKHRNLRNALSHGLFWYENENIFYVDNIARARDL